MRGWVCGSKVLPSSDFLAEPKTESQDRRHGCRSLSLPRSLPSASGAQPLLLRRSCPSHRPGRAEVWSEVLKSPRLYEVELDLARLSLRFLKLDSLKPHCSLCPTPLHPCPSPPTPPRPLPATGFLRGSLSCKQLLWEDPGPPAAADASPSSRHCQLGPAL